MSNAWYHYLGPLTVSTMFVLAGIWSLCLYWLGGRAPDGTRKVGLIHAIVGAVFCLGVGGTFGIPFLLTSPTPRQRQEIWDQFLHTPPEQIERYIIEAGRADWGPLTTTEVVIDDPARIRQIAELLLTTVPDVPPSRISTRWFADVKMVTRDGTYRFMVQATAPGHSHGARVGPYATESRWNLGSVFVNGLDTILEDAVAKAKKAE